MADFTGVLPETGRASILALGILLVLWARRCQLYGADSVASLVETGAPRTGAGGEPASRATPG